jgi:hypothetical protein
MREVESAGDRVRNRIADSIALSITFIVLIGVGGAFSQSLEILSETSGTSAETGIMIFESVTYLPTLITIVGISGAVIFGGPLGGIGAVLETVGASSLLTDPSTGDMVMLTVGAIFVVVGQKFWSPKNWIQILTSQSSSRGPPKRR